MTKRRVSDEEFERQYQAVKRARQTPELQASAAWYDKLANELVVKLKNGSTITTPISALPELAEAKPEDIATVELSRRGEALHWEALDQDFSVGGLIVTVFGNKRFMAELGRIGGSATTEAKAIAARENGRKGGRPAKAMIAVAARAFSGDLLIIRISGESQQSTNDLAKYETGLTSVSCLVDSPAVPNPAGHSLGNEEREYLTPAITSSSGEEIEEAPDDAELPIAA